MITRQFESSSTSAVYIAQLNPATGETSCTCPAWRFKKPGRDRSCKHVKTLANSSAVRMVNVTPAQFKAVDTTHLLPEEDAKSGFVAGTVKPMLASAMTKTMFADYTNDAWLLEEKFDGQRVMVRKSGDTVQAFSRPRAGKAAIARTLPDGVITALRAMPDGFYDGELVSPGGRSWQVARLDTRSTQILVLFDVLDIMGESVAAKSYTERHALLLLAVAHHTNTTEVVRIVAPESVPVTADAVIAIWERGGEGAILKRAAAPYQPGKRSSDWIKVKKSATAVLTLTGFEAGKMGPYSKLELRTANGDYTTVKTLGNQMLADVAANPSSFIGRRVVIAYAELTDTGKFRHGVFDHFAGAGE